MLASLEAEPVAFIGKRMLEDLIYSAISRGRIWSDVTDKISGESRIPLYTAPPALKVPDALPEQENYHGNDIDYMPPSDVYQLGKTRGWNACRAAMLHGAEPVSKTYKLNQLSGNSPVTPDGWISCSERMPEKYDFDIWVFSPSRGVLDGLQWDGSMFTDDEYQFVIHDATHWMRKAYPAAPQQDGE
ncbi:DUF551 domain-containing protein [Escherichia coli]|nr:DUF551 domain-containing protein [Escherichia coli]